MGTSTSGDIESARRAVARGRLGAGTLALVASLTLCPTGAASAKDSTAGLRAPKVEVDGSGDPGAGHVTVRWSASTHEGRSPSFQVEESASPSFEPASIQYEGLHESSVVSGLTDGKRYFRVRASVANGPWGPWSEPYVFETRHHSLALAGSLFAVGALAFGLTAAFVIHGARAAPGGATKDDGRG